MKGTLLAVSRSKSGSINTLWDSFWGLLVLLILMAYNLTWFCLRCRILVAGHTLPVKCNHWHAALMTGIA